MNKLMTLLLLSLLVTPLCANDDGDDVGPQGPAGPVGATGPIGPVGPKGLTGANGSNGVNGPSGTNGTNGTNGANGTNGKAGVQGVQGPQGVSGENGLNATRENIGATIRWWDAKHYSLTSGYRYDVNHCGQEIDMITVNAKLGKSYEERLLEKLQRQLNRLENR